MTKMISFVFTLCVLAFSMGCSSTTQKPATSPTTPAPSVQTEDGNCNPGLPVEQYQACLENMLYGEQLAGKEIQFKMTPEGRCQKDGVDQREYFACLQAQIDRVRAQREKEEAKNNPFLSPPGATGPAALGGIGPFAFGGRQGVVTSCGSDFASRSYQVRMDTHLFEEQGQSSSGPGQFMLRVEGDFWPCNLAKHRMMRSATSSMPVYFLPVAHGVWTDYTVIRDARCQSTPNPRVEWGCKAEPTLKVSLYRDLGANVFPELVGSEDITSWFKLPSSQGRSVANLAPQLFMH